MKLAIILGTRPEIIKMSPVLKHCQAESIPFSLIHTGQHYSQNMDQQFFQELGLQQPDYNLHLHLGTYREQLTKMVMYLIPILQQEKPDIVLVQGDTVSVLAGALATKHCGITLAHHEAGLRSHDLQMIEEVNRIVTDSVTDIFFCPTGDAIKNLHEEGHKEHLYLTGNTIVDAVLQHKDDAKRKSKILSQHNLRPMQYMLVTLHRAENVDNKERLALLFQGLEAMHAEFHLPLLYPIHPRTKKRIEEFSLKIPSGIQLIDPVGFLDFLQLESNALLILTDSGGVQEEACTLGVPCITLRDSTERPETVTVGANIVTGMDTKAILLAAKKMAEKRGEWKNPFGDGTAGKKIVDVLAQYPGGKK